MAFLLHRVEVGKRVLAPAPAAEHRSSINALVEKCVHKDSDTCSRVGKQPQVDISKLRVIVRGNGQ